MKTKSILIPLTVAALCAAETFAAPMGTGFTYQGRLTDGGQPANSLYDLTFTLHDDPLSLASIGNSITLAAVPVTNGLFTVQLNANGEFGASAFTGQARWLQIGVRTNSANPFVSFTLLAPSATSAVVARAVCALRVECRAGGQRKFRQQRHQGPNGQRRQFRRVGEYHGRPGGLRRWRG